MHWFFLGYYLILALEVKVEPWGNWASKSWNSYVDPRRCHVWWFQKPDIPEAQAGKCHSCYCSSSEPWLIETDSDNLIIWTKVLFFILCGLAPRNLQDCFHLIDVAHLLHPTCTYYQFIVPKKRWGDGLKAHCRLFHLQTLYYGNYLMPTFSTSLFIFIP